MRSFCGLKCAATIDECQLDEYFYEYFSAAIVSDWVLHELKVYPTQAGKVKRELMTQIQHWHKVCNLSKLRQLADQNIFLLALRGVTTVTLHQR